MEHRNWKRTEMGSFLKLILTQVTGLVVWFFQILVCTTDNMKIVSQWSNTSYCYNRSRWAPTLYIIKKNWSMLLVLSYTDLWNEGLALVKAIVIVTPITRNGNFNHLHLFIISHGWRTLIFVLLAMFIRISASFALLQYACGLPTNTTSGYCKSETTFTPTRLILEVLLFLTFIAL